MHILIAEDDPVARHMLERSLQTLGHTVSVTTTLAEARAAFDEDFAIEAIISDGMMPDLDDGISLCRHVRDTEDRFAYFILLAAADDLASRRSGMLAGADDYLTKPLQREELELRLIAAERVTRLYRKLQEQRQRLVAVARRDSLTGVRNRLALKEDLERLQAQMVRYGNGYSIALFDVDHFKAFNDAQGHLAGDGALKVVADVLTLGCRASDTVYRYGGEEFCVVYPETAIQEAFLVTKRLTEALVARSVPHPESERGILTMSAGVARARPDQTVDTLVQRADKALYEAKEAGRNRVVPAPQELPPT